jgi:hypothetical protein
MHGDRRGPIHCLRSSYLKQPSYIPHRLSSTGLCYIEERMPVLHCALLHPPFHTVHTQPSGQLLRTTSMHFNLRGRYRTLSGIRQLVTGSRHSSILFCTSPLMPGCSFLTTLPFWAGRTEADAVGSVCGMGIRLNSSGHSASSYQEVDSLSLSQTGSYQSQESNLCVMDRWTKSYQDLPSHL